MFTKWHDFIGEMTGSFILVFFVCGSVTVTVLFSSLIGLFQIAIVWGVGVTLGVYASRYLSCAYLNPVVNLGMVVAGRRHARRLPVYMGLPVFKWVNMRPRR